MATTTQTLETKRAAPGGMMAAGILAVAGLAAWIYQFNQGMRVTGLGQQVVWGLYIAGFFTAMGAGAGLLGLVGLSEYRPLLGPSGRTRALVLALAAFIAAGVLIMMDLGNPVQVWRLVIGLRFSSMMTWDFWLLAIAGVVTLVYLLAARGGQAQKGLGALGLLAAVLVVVVEGWMLSNLSARPLWGSGLTVLTFLLGAAITGLSLALLLQPEVTQLRAWLGFALGLSLVFVLAEVLTGLLSGEISHSVRDATAACGISGGGFLVPPTGGAGATADFAAGRLVADSWSSGPAGRTGRKSLVPGSGPGGALASPAPR